MKNRIITSFILIGIFVPLFLLGGTAANLMIGIVVAMAIYELSSFRHKQWMPWIRNYLVVSITGLCFIPNPLFFWLLFMHSFSLFLISLVDEKFTIIDVLLFSVMGLVLTYAGHSAMYLFGLGTIPMIYVTTITYTVDTCAFFGGKLFGRHKLIERISPKKTWEGAVAGFLGGFLVSGILLFVWNEYSLGISLLLSVTLAMMGQFGDLLFSSIKRHFDIKDFSSLLPGHGGLLDRIDSLLINIVMMRFIIQIVGELL